MKWSNGVKLKSTLMWGMALAALMTVAGGVKLGRAESSVDKRIEEFKAGMHKGAVTGEAGKHGAAPEHGAEKKAAETSHGAEKKAPAAHAPTKTEHPAAHVPVKKEKHAAPKAAAHKAPAGQAAAGGHGGHAVSVDADEALKTLMEGNQRYQSGKVKGPNRSTVSRTEHANSQHPIAVVVSCSDSRVPPELLFDQGFGDLFVVRTAGNVVDSIALGSIEYAVDHLGSKLIVVLGHERCGAVTAALQGGEAPGNIKSVVDAIKPAVEKGKARHSGHGEVLDTCIISNVKQVAQKIRTTAPILSEKVEDGMVKVVGAYYDLDSGAVNMTYMPN